MDQPSPQSPRPENTLSARYTPRVGRVSEFVGSRLLLIGLLAGLMGSALLVFAGIKLWLVVTRRSLGSDVVPLVVGGSLAFALLSIGVSARRSGLKYLRGQKAVARRRRPVRCQANRAAAAGTRPLKHGSEFGPTPRRECSHVE